MARFNEAQLEQVFVELFKEQGYDYVHGENISHDTRAELSKPQIYHLWRIT